jgi:hypothetical protein
LFRCWLILVVLGASAAGCGTTKWSDTARTATEQMLISTAVDRAVDHMNFRPLAGKSVFFDTTYLSGIVDQNYLVGTLRQHMLSQGCILKVDRDQADYVVEARAGAVGTDHHDVLIGVPAISVPTGGMVAGVPSAIPEIPFAKTTDQRGVVKLAAFAYNQRTGQAVWQSGVIPVVSNAKDTWFLGTGPFQRGTIYDGTHFAGSRFLFSRKRNRGLPPTEPGIGVTAEAVFEERPALARAAAKSGQSGGKPAGQAATAPKPAAPPAPAAPNSTTAGNSNGLQSGQVIKLPALVAPPSTTSGTSNASTSGSGGLSLNPGSWLRLK